MANIIKEGLLSGKWKPCVQICRNTNRVNIQRPKPPHYERARLLALVQPIYRPKEESFLPPSLRCTLKQEKMTKEEKPDNPLERIVAGEVLEKFKSSKLVAFLHMNPFRGEDMFEARLKFKRESMVIETHSKRTVSRAVTGTRFEPVMCLFASHTGIVFCDEPKVTQLLKIVKKIPQCVLLAAIVEDKFMSVSQMTEYSNLKDLTTGRAHLVSVLNSAALQLHQRINLPQTQLIARLQQMSEKDQS